MYTFQTKNVQQLRKVVALYHPQLLALQDAGSAAEVRPLQCLLRLLRPWRAPILKLQGSAGIL